MQDTDDEKRPPVQGIGGWLLCYVVLSSLALVVMLVSSIQDVLLIMSSPELLLPVLSTLFITIVWGLVYARALYELIRLRRGAVSRIRKVILLSPIVNALLPFIFSLALFMKIPGAGLAAILAAAYDMPNVANIVSSFLVAGIWYWYFKVSLRVRNTWPEER
ncbi:DUF2569 family protein [uncultured Mailhella sp.]|uniref:DUF2569 family protein n=1 Tax=uncultured Mailhella sp. TaxID=1981031 RepID=UPI0026322569|nr:DUF2569 family protein [uncultured Mailhella sp.]